ncbi:MAG: TonB family protein, partial [Synergistaceae bacterium]|nr:TonB family protein [Synergistaceae bacterium]
MRRSISAAVMSAAVHAMLLSSLGTLSAAKPESQVIRVSLRHMPKPEPIPAPEPPASQSPQPPAVPAPEPKPAPEPVKQPEKPAPPKPKPKPEPPKPKPEQPKPKPKPAPVKENPVKQAVTEKPQPAENPQPETASSAASAPAEAVKLPPSGGAASGAASPGSVSSHSVVDVSSLTVTKKVTPVYPMISRKRKEQGTVTLLVTIASGAVKSVEIEKSSGHSPLDESAVQAVRGWKFELPGAASVTARIP